MEIWQVWCGRLERFLCSWDLGAIPDADTAYMRLKVTYLSDVTWSLTLCACRTTSRLSQVRVLVVVGEAVTRSYSKR
jgi:hypothetical protein